MAQSVLIKGGIVVTMDAANTIVAGDVLVRDGRIASIGDARGPADLTIDARGCAVLPGFVQTHVHLCQTLFRGAADDLELIDWLKRRVWPMEAAHDARSLRASARLGVAELIRGGTTCALTMETVGHTEEVFRVVEETGLRATGLRNVEYLDSVGVSGPHVLLAHCVHVNAREIDLLAGAGTHVAHCPSSNMKLGSGVAPVAEMLERGVSVSLGADGAPCNNRLDMFTEMRAATLLQKVSRGAEALPAARGVRMATACGARAPARAVAVGGREA